jgi:thiol-disulfide isomerase/thioredoxin
MRKPIKLAMYSLLAAGLGCILFVLVKSLIPPTSNSMEQKAGPVKPVLGELITLSPRPAQPEGVFLDETGADKALSDFTGKVILLNIWATWCEPCVKEMPSLDALQAKMGSDDFQVVAISADRSAEEAKAFYADNQIIHLAFYQDKGFDIVRGLYVEGYPSGLPVTVLYSRDGKELARLSGGFDWVSDIAIARIQAAISDGVSSTNAVAKQADQPASTN